MKLSTFAGSVALLALGRRATAIELDITDENSIKTAASTLAADLMSFYHGDEPGNIPGLLPGPPPDPTVIDGRYFWWEAGAMFGTMLDYWYYTGDETYNDVTYQALQFQVGEDKDYNPKNQSNGMGNDDQAFWGMAAMTAAEFGFRDPPPDQPQWLALAQAVFNTQQRRIMPADAPCGAGLRWQVFSNLNGFQYMNSISNGCFINIAARLAAYTKNDTYAQNAAAIWDWMEDRGFIDEQMNVYDGGHIQNGCKDINLVQFSYNAGVMLLASATMYNYTNGSSLWQDRTDRLLNRTINVFFPDGICEEVACEENMKCTVDMLSYKAFLTRWMAAATKVYPAIYDKVMGVLRTSAVAAAAQCSGGDNGRMCGLRWYQKDQWDGTLPGVGQQMAALEVIQSLLVEKAHAPKSVDTGGTSTSDPNAGLTDPKSLIQPVEVTGKDRAGAGVLTAVVLLGVCSMFAFMAI